MSAFQCIKSRNMWLLVDVIRKTNIMAFRDTLNMHFDIKEIASTLNKNPQSDDAAKNMFWSTVESATTASLTFVMRNPP